MRKLIGTIDLTRLTAEREDVVESMARELEGPKVEQPSSVLRRPARFISAGPKGAPPRWGTRFLAAGPKNAPTRH